MADRKHISLPLNTSDLTSSYHEATPRIRPTSSAIKGGASNQQSSSLNSIGPGTESTGNAMERKAKPVAQKTKETSGRSPSASNMPGIIDTEITYTPTTHRISKAKKGKKVHACTFPGCNKVRFGLTHYFDLLLIQDTDIYQGRTSKVSL